jgi:DNA recombination protein RmuC
MENIIIIGLIVLIVLVIALIVLVISKKSKSNENGVNPDFLNDMSRRVDEINQSLNTQTQSLSNTVNNQNQLTNQTLQRQQQFLSDQFTNSSKIISEITEKMTKFEETNRNVLNATGKLENLQNILLNPKHRGNFGEFQLESALENIFAPGQWQRQYSFKNGEIVDAVIFLKDNKLLPIDSKFSLENYNRMINENDPANKQLLLNEVYKDLKTRVDETSKYIKPSENTMDFAFMFIPSEALYYDLLTAATGAEQFDLIDYAYIKRKVIIVSPTTFVAYLQTVLQGLRSLQIEKDAKDIKSRVEKLATHLNKYENYIKKLGNSLTTTVNHYNDAYKNFGYIDKDVVKITNGETFSEVEKIDKPLLED